ncbi:hypothetical protein D3C76_637000 [compost metagenome]
MVVNLVVALKLRSSHDTQYGMIIGQIIGQTLRVLLERRFRENVQPSFFIRIT